MGKQPVAWEEYCAEYWLKELQESMDRCTGCRDITERLLKTVLNTIQSITQPNLKNWTCYVWDLMIKPYIPCLWKKAKKWRLQVHTAQGLTISWLAHLNT